MTRCKRLLKVVLMLVISLIFIGGCANSSKANNGSKSSENNNNSKYPLKIKNKFGTTVIKQKPKRIVTIQWGNQDVSLALGVVPVGFSAANFGVKDNSGLLPWTKKKLDQLDEKNPNVYKDTDGLDFEAIADSKPDVILAAYSGITKEEYKTLSKIAPVVAYPKLAWTTSWKEQIHLDSKGMGMEKQGDKLIKQTEQK